MARGRHVAAITAAVATITSCGADLPPVDTNAESFAFGVFGDGPYYGIEEGRFRRMLADVEASSVTFLLHVGDILWYPCSDEKYLSVREALGGLGQPVVYTPGDNEWTDCHEGRPGGYDPLDRLAAIRRIFFADTNWNNAVRLNLGSQAADSQWSTFVENQQWEVGGIVFATIHMVGSENALEDFRGRTDANDREVEGREAAALAWMDAAFARAETRAARAVVLAIHADPDFEGRWESQLAYGRFRARLAELATRWTKPVLFVHGDNHELTVDRPLVDPGTKDTVWNVTRLETMGSPDIGWIRVVVDTNGPELFSFEPRHMGRAWW